ncbi:hypothetical protein HZC32_03100 [Candidatus Woesearchaeota archaeon]|nr:hypothetical protein [Candidatus Woesearchaeota archaeon]
MVLDFNKNLPKALEEVSFTGEHRELVVYEHERDYDEIIEHYGKMKWKVADLLNERYGSILEDRFDLYNWLHYNERDELAYFLNEAGSNCLNYSKYKAPYKFHVWLGNTGFVVGIEQQGEGFPAELIHNQKVKQNEGAAFKFFNKCRSTIFFDDSKDAKMVLMEYRGL